VKVQSITLRIALTVLAAYALVSLVQVYMGIYAGADEARAWWAPALMVLVRIAYLAALTPLVLYLGRRFRIQSPHEVARAVLHLLIVSLIAPGYAAAILLARFIVLDGLDISLWDVLVNRVDDVVLYYAVLLGIAYAVEYYQEARARDAAAASLRYELAQAQLHALRTQLQPHFLFNTLNSIAELVHRDADRADQMIGRLGDLLRRSLEHGQLETVPLRDELETVRLYVGIQQVRYPQQLRVSYRISAETHDAAVPVFLLQPLVENAIQHGIDRVERAGEVVISAERSGEQLIVEVTDNGVGLPIDGDISEGIGLQSVRARLQSLFGSGYRFELRRDRASSGAVAHLTIPFTRVADPGPAPCVPAAHARNGRLLSTRPHG
jgi:signal transduction histidine kinase